MAFKPLGSLLRKNVQAKGMSYQVEAAMALQYFDEVVEDLWQGKMKGRAKPLYLKDHILTVASLSPVFSQELRLKQAAVVSYINDKAGHEIISNLRFMS